MAIKPKSISEITAQMIEQMENSFYGPEFGDGVNERKLRKVLYKLGIKSAHRGSLEIMGLDAFLRSEWFDASMLGKWQP